MGRGEIEITEADEAHGIALAQKIESDDVNAYGRLEYSVENGATGSPDAPPGPRSRTTPRGRFEDCPHWPAPRSWA